MNTSPIEFDPTTVLAMNDIAELLQISRAMREMVPEFKNHPDLDFETAKPDANRVLKAVSSASTSILKAILRSGTEQKLQVRLSKVRTTKRKNLENAAHLASKLASHERAATKSAITRGNFLSFRVHGPLERLVKKWANS